MKKSSKEAKQNRLREGHLPLRTCIACRTTGMKRELIRIIRGTWGVEIDHDGKKSGRGAYLCPVFECWEEGLNGNRLEHSLRAKLGTVERQILVEYGRSLPKRSKLL